MIKRIIITVSACALAASVVVGCGAFMAHIADSSVSANETNTHCEIPAIETDVVKLGSPIRIEKTVREGWDKNEKEIMQAIEAAIEACGVVDGMTQKEAITRINDYLCQSIFYSDEAGCRTIRGALIRRRAVCVGYTLAFMYMAHYCGINAVYVHGYTTETAHAWNGVYFSDGSYYEVDVTMNDTSGEFHTYLLLTPDAMEQLHFW